MSLKLSWRTCFSEFVAEATRLYASGRSAKLASKKFAGGTVRWTGTVAKLEPDQKYGDRLYMTMGGHSLLETGVTVFCDHVVLPVSRAATAVPLESLALGDVIDFEATFLPPGHVFSSIRFMEDPDENAMFVLLSFASARILARRGRAKAAD